MRKAWRSYLIFHGAALGAALLFFLYGIGMQWLFPDGYYHCFLHDVLFLYCPFCGGTRAFLSLLRFNLLDALRLNPAVIIAGIAALILDVRALHLLLTKREGKMLPRRLLPVAVIYFAAYTWISNSLMLFGVDPVGDLAPRWEALALWQRIGASVALLLLLSSFTYALFGPRKSWRLPAVWIAVACLPLLAVFLTGFPLWLVLWMPLLAAVLQQYKKRLSMPKDPE